MNLFKRNVILSFSIFLIALSIGCALFGYYGAGKIQSTQDTIDKLTWLLEPSEVYDYIDFLDKENLFIAERTEDKAQCLLDSTGAVVNKVSASEILSNGYYTYKVDDSYGIKDKNDQIIIKADFSYVYDEGNYFVAFSEENIPSIYTLEGKHLHTGSESADVYYLKDDQFYIYPWSNKDCYIFHAETQAKESIVWDDLTFESLYINEQGELYGACAGIVYFLDENFDVNKEKPIYDQYDELSEGLRYVVILDKKTDKVTPCYINEQGEVIIKLEGDVPESAGPFREDKALIEQNNKLICIDKTGKELFRLDVKRRDSSFTFYDTYIYSEGLAAVSLDGDKYGYIDASGEFIIPAIFDIADEIKNGYAPVAFYRDDYQYGILDFNQGGVTDAE